MSFTRRCLQFQESVLQRIREAPDTLTEFLNEELFTPSDLAEEMFCEEETPLIDFRISWIESPSVIRCGEEEFIHTRSEIDELSLELDPNAKVRARRLATEYPRSKLCSCAGFNETRFFACDNFTVRNLVRYIVQALFREIGLPHCSMLHYAYVEDGTAHSVYDMISIGSFDDFLAWRDLNEDSVIQIITQLAVIFTFLREHHYNHGTASVHSLLFRDEPVDYLYKGNRVVSDFTVQLTDMWHSSISYAGSHFFEKTEDMVTPPFIPQIEQRTGTSEYCKISSLGGLVRPLSCADDSETCNTSEDLSLCEQKQIVVFRMTGNTYQIYNEVRHLGVPIFSGVFDFYCLFVSLMCNEKFYRIVQASPFLRKLWSSLWLPEDYPEVERRLYEQHSKNWRYQKDYSKERQAIDILRSRYLRCDALETVWQILKSK